MTRKVLIDCDPGIDDAIALCIALFDERFELVSVAATAGNVSAPNSSRNVQAILNYLDPPRWPRLGMARQQDSWLRPDGPALHGPEGLAGMPMPFTELHHPHPSDKVIVDTVRNYPNEVTIVCLGPLTNLSGALRLDPDLVTLVNQVIVGGGAINGVGDVTPSAEFNIYSDPLAARAIFHSPMTKTLVPLDITRQVMFTLEMLDQLPEPSSRAGALLHSLLPFSFRAHRQVYGLEGVYLHDAVTLMAAFQPELFQTTGMAGDVETQGQLTRGATIFDRRARPVWRNNMVVATEVDVAGVKDSILRGLVSAGQQTA